MPFTAAAGVLSSMPLLNTMATMSLVLLGLLSSAARGAPIISRARGETMLEVPMSPEFSEVRAAVNRFQALGSLPPAKVPLPTPPLKREARRLPHLQYSVFDATLNEQEQQCRERCVARFTASFEFTEAAICEAHAAPDPSVASGPAATFNAQLAFDSCGAPRPCLSSSHARTHRRSEPQP